MGQAKRRKEAGAHTRVGALYDQHHMHIPGTITVHIFYKSTTLSVSVPLIGLFETVVDFASIAGRYRDLENNRDRAREVIIEELQTNKRRTQDRAFALGVTALWLASTAPEAGKYFRSALEEEGQVALFLTDSTYGRATFNSRVAWFPPDIKWQQIAATSA